MIRMQQRGVKDKTIDLIRDYGEGHYHKGAWVTCFNNKAYEKAIRSLPTLKKEIDRARKLYIVEIDSKLITVAPRTKKLKKDCRHY